MKIKTCVGCHFLFGSKARPECDRFSKLITQIATCDLRKGATSGATPKHGNNQPSSSQRNYLSYHSC